MKKITSLALAAVMCLSLCACGPSAALTEFETLMSEIGEVTLDSEAAIIAAEEAYAALTEEEKSEAAEIAVQLTQSRKAYDELVKVEETISLIDAIGTVSLESGSAINSAKSAYNQLSADSKSQVSNYSTLEKAEEEYNTIRAAEKERIIQEYMPKFSTEEDKVRGLKFYTPKVVPYYADTRCYILPYIAENNGDFNLVITYHFTDDDWVFWKQVIVAADEKRYTVSVNYHDVIRDNEYGNVWEWYDEALDVNLPMDADRIQMLQAIANSTETIVRFQGDEYVFDFTVTAEDKTAITETLALYSALIS